MSKPFILGLVTARSGSIRLPNKNIKSFCGHPLFSWSIMQSRCSRLIDATVLTTDSEQYAEIGRRYGAKVIMRPKMDDDITAGVPFKMAVEELEKEGMKIDEIVCLFPTSPLKKPEDLDNMIQAYHLMNQFDGSVEMSTFSPDRECFIYKNLSDMTTNYGKPYYLQNVIANKNWDFSKLGGWNIANRDYLMNTWGKVSQYDSVLDQQLKDIMFDGGKKILGYSIEPWQCFETDYEVYFNICEVLMENFILKGQGMNVYTRYAREFRKIVTWEEETKKIDFSQYVGNSNQLGE